MLKCFFILYIILLLNHTLVCVSLQNNAYTNIWDTKDADTYCALENTFWAKSESMEVKIYSLKVNYYLKREIPSLRK